MKLLQTLRQIYRNLLFELLSWIHPPDKHVQEEKQQLQAYFNKRVEQHQAQPEPTVTTPVQPQQGIRARAREHQREVVYQQWQSSQQSGDLWEHHREVEQQKRFITRKLDEPPTNILPRVKSSFFASVHIAAPETDSLVIEDDSWLNSTPVSLPVIETPPAIDMDATDEVKAISQLLHSSKRQVLPAQDVSIFHQSRAS